VKTARQRHGASAEDEAVAYLAGHGWRIVVRNLKIGRDEIDVLALDPGPPATLVVVEVRSLRTASFGEPEERSIVPRWRGSTVRWQGSPRRSNRTTA
jgi:Holliday junction resolvase-like predicted endonuclease